MILNKLLLYLLPEHIKKTYRQLSTVNQIRFRMILKINSLCLLFYPFIVYSNLRTDNFRFAFINSCYVLLSTIPTLYACLKLKLKFSLYYSLTTFYVAILLYYGISVQYKLDTYCELLFITLSVFCIIFLNGKASVIISFFLLANFIGCRLYMDQLNLIPVRQGVLINSTSIFLALFVMVYYAKVIALNNQFKVVKEQQELHKNYLELSEANQLKDKTFGMIGHDLRSPLAALKAQLQVLRTRADTNQELSEHSYELNRLVDTIQGVHFKITHKRLPFP